jgi:uncharacterized membrane protein YhaH (DUF805 family)
VLIIYSFLHLNKLQGRSSMIKYWVMFVVWSTVVIYGLIGMGAAFVAKGLGSHILEVSVLLSTAWTVIIGEC